MTETESPFTIEQFKALTPEQVGVIDQVAHYLGWTASPICHQKRCRKPLKDNLDLLTEGDGGCVPSGYEEDLHLSIRKKFACLLWPAMETADKVLGLKFGLCLVVDVSYDDATHVAVLDYEQPCNCYYHFWEKAWGFRFSTLAEITDFVLAVRDEIVKNFRLNLNTEKL